MKTAALLAALLLAAPASAADKPMKDDQQVFYALGLELGRNVEVFALSAAELELVKKGLADRVAGKQPAVELEAMQPKIQELARARRAAKGEKLAAAGKDALEKASKEKGAVKTDSGLVYVPVVEGKGPVPAASDTVKVHYRGTLVDGTEFDSSIKRGQPAEFPLSGVIRCWTEGVQRIRVGGKAKLVCPSALAYGERGAGNSIPPNATLVFEVELLDIVKK